MTAPTTGPRIKVLIAEDEEHLGTILEQFLLGRAYQVTVTRDGASALAALRSEAYDVALLDIVMPEMDGLEVLRHIREEPNHPEVIIITGNGTIETAITAIRLGAYDYLSKRTGWRRSTSSLGAPGSVASSRTRTRSCTTACPAWTRCRRS